MLWVLCYNEYRNRQKEKETISLNQLLKKSGIEKPPAGKHTPKK